MHSRRAIVARARPSDSRWQGEALDVGAARPEHRHPVFGAPGQVLAQVERVSVAGEAAVAGQEPCQRQLLGGAEQLVSRDERRACRDGNVHGGPPSVDAEAPVAGIGQAAPALIRGRRPYVWPARSLQSEACLCQGGVFVGATKRPVGGGRSVVVGSGSGLSEEPASGCKAGHAGLRVVPVALPDPLRLNDERR